MNPRKIRRHRRDHDIYRLLAWKSGPLQYLESRLEVLWAIYLDRVLPRRSEHLWKGR